MSGSVGQQLERRNVTRAPLVFVLATIAVAVLVAPRGAGHVLAGPATASYVAMTPYRLADTRAADCGCTRLDAGTIAVSVAGRPGVPDGAVAVSVTVTAPATGGLGFVTLYPGGTARPVASELNTRADRPVANSRSSSSGRPARSSCTRTFPGI